MTSNLDGVYNESDSIPHSSDKLEVLAKPFDAKTSPKKASSEKWDPPATGIVTSSFGKRTNPVLNKEEVHNGTDIAVNTGTPAIAMTDGEIIHTGTSPTFGINVKYRTNDGLVILYAHLSAVTVKNGDKVKKGDVIAKTGNTGLSTGPHIHVSVYKSGKEVDPLLYIKGLKLTGEAKNEYLARGEKAPV